jgi:H/ACA ribonucleoprotein complex non-core subunit NAF1
MTEVFGLEAQQPSSEPTTLKEEEPREWETDSSPIESSSDDSSSDDSSDEESEDGDNAYTLLSPEEQAKILMEGDGGSDDEGGNKAKGAGAQLRTKNEVPEVVIPKPDVTITEEMSIEELGAVEAIVENILLIKAKTSGEYRVLETASVLCLADRSVIGVVSETLGRVQQPLYSVLFTNAGEIAEAKLELGTKVFYSEQHSTYVFTQALKAYKGSDASNLHDEEVGDEEMEFSDDEAEMEHKRRVKQAKRGRGGKTQYNGGSGRGGHPLQQQQTPYDASKGLNYDEVDDDGPYKPLSRPVGYADSVGRTEPPEEGAYQGGPNGNTHNQNRDSFRGRGRGDRGRGRGDRGRGDRGRGRGAFQDRRGASSGHSLPPQGRPNYSQLPPNSNPGQNFTPPFQPQGRGFPQSGQTPPSMPPTAYNNMAYSPHQPQLPAWPQFPPQPPYQQPFQNMPNMQNMWPNMPPQAPLQSGAFINPAFFGNPQGNAPNQWNPHGQQRGGRGGS